MSHQHLFVNEVNECTIDWIVDAEWTKEAFWRTDCRSFCPVLQYSLLYTDMRDVKPFIYSSKNVGYIFRLIDKWFIDK